MKRTQIIALAMVGAVSGSAFAFNETDHWTISGYLDLYFVKSWNHPSGSLLPGRAYDIHHKSPMFADYGLLLQRKAGNGIPVGVTLEFYGGRNSYIDNMYEPGGAEFRPVKQAYLSYGDADGRWGIDFGIFNTWMGYETRDAIDNVNYSRSMAYTYLNPVYHNGAKFWLKFGEAWTVGLAGVKGWNEINDSNDDWSYGGYVEYQKGPMTARLNMYSGTEGDDNEDGGFFGANGTDVDAWGAMFKYKVNDKLNVGLDFSQLDVDQDDEDASLNSMSFYGQYQLCENMTLGARFEQFSDDDDALAGDASAFTISLDKKVSDHGKVRLEFRSDNADNDIYPGRNSFKDSQTTYSVSYQIKIK